MSPTAKMSGSEVRSAASTAMPPPARSRPAASARATFGMTPDADHDRLGLDGSTTDQLHRRHGAVAAEPRHPGAQPEVDVMITMEVGEHRADLLADDPDQGLGEGIEHHDLGIVLAGRSGDLAADPAGPDDDDLCAGREALPEGQRVVQRPQGEQAVEIRSGKLQPPRGRAGGDDQLVVRMIIAARDDDLAVPVDPGGDGARQQRRLVGPEGLVGDPVRLVDLALHQGLRQRRPLVRAVHLLTDQGELPAYPWSRRATAADPPASDAPTMTMRDGCAL